MLIRKASNIFLSLLYSGTNHNYPCLNGNHIFFGVGVGVYISTMKYAKADFDGYVYLKSSDGLIDRIYTGYLTTKQSLSRLSCDLLFESKKIQNTYQDSILKKSKIQTKKFQKHICPLWCKIQNYYLYVQGMGATPAPCLVLIK